MIYAIINVLGTVAYSSCYKVAGRWRCHPPAVQLGMYASGTLLSLIIALSQGGFSRDPRLWALAAVGSVLLLISVRTFFLAMQQGGLAVGWTFVSLSTIIPVVASILFWHEIPKLWQTVGLLLFIPCLLAFGDLRLQVEGDRRRWGLLVGLSTLASGVGVTLLKVLSDFTGGAAGRPAAGNTTFSYLVLLYGGGGAFLALRGEGRRLGLRAPETWVGAAMGGFSVLATWAFVRGLELLPAIVFLPIRTTAAIILTVLVAVLVWGERLTRRHVVGIGLGTVSAVLLNLK